MSHLTRCPACGTTFRVVSDQLRLADGWVRCGACQHVYDALPGLQDELASAPPPEERVAALVEAPADALVDAPAETAPDAPIETPPEAPPPEFWPTPDAAPTTDPLLDDVPMRAVEPEAVAAGAAQAAQPMAKPAFVRQAERRAFWRRPLVRLGLGLTTLLLALLLGAQAAWWWRDQLATRWPPAQPWLAMLCQPLGCTVGAPRAPQALRIDSSALIRREGNRYRFELVVKNDASHAVAAPDLELTLLDATQAVRLQRVLPAAEWPGAKVQLMAGETWSVRFEFELAPAVAERMAGYRAWLFYL